MRQICIRDQVTLKLTAVGHRTAFNNLQNPTVKGPKNEKCRTIQARKLTAHVCTKQ